MPAPSRRALLLCALLAAGCRSSAPTGAAPVIAAFTATPAIIQPGEASTLAWTVSGATSVAIDPGVGAAAGASAVVTPTVSTTYTLSAVNARGTSTATAQVTVASAPPVVTVTVSPKTARVPLRGTRAFTAEVAGSSNRGVTWSVEEGSAGGAVDDRGVYMAPAATGTFHLRATSKADASKSDRATVDVFDPAAVLPPGEVSGDVIVSMDSRTATPISPLIYGINFAELGGTNPASLWGTYLPRYTLNRFGGNRTSAFNWETGVSNCGDDCKPDFPSDNNLTDNVAAAPGIGAAVKPRVDGAFAANAAIVLTVPILGFVPKDTAARNPVPAAPSATQPATPDPAHWLRALPQDPAGPTASPVVTDGAVYTDDFVKWVDTRYPAARTDPVRSIDYELDNEPDIWSGTHVEVRGLFAGGPNRGQVPTGFDELVEKSLSHARAIKSVVPGARVWAGGFAGFDGLTQLNYDAHPGGPPSGYVYYLDYFLEKLKAAESTSRGRMVDVLDFHWYVRDWRIPNDDQPQDAATIDAREQAPRSLWDPDYIEQSWVTTSVPGADQARCDASGACPLHIVTRVQDRVAKFYPGTRIAIGEYWYGRGGDISAAIANADVLGILGRLGVYAATMWPNASNIWAYNVPNGCHDSELCAMTHAYSCALKAIDLYRSYDGQGARFGDTAIATSVADPLLTSPATQRERVTAYASVDAGNPRRATIVAINKSQTQALNLGLRLTHNQAFSKAAVYQLTGTNGGAGGCTGPVQKPDVAIAAVNAFNAIVPAQSVTLFVLEP